MMNELTEDAATFLIVSGHVRTVATAFIEEQFGERCTEYEPECECCKRWKALDIILENPWNESTLTKGNTMISTPAVAELLTPTLVTPGVFRHGDTIWTEQPIAGVVLPQGYKSPGFVQRLKDGNLYDIVYLAWSKYGAEPAGQMINFVQDVPGSALTLATDAELAALVPDLPAGETEPLVFLEILALLKKLR